MLKNTSHFGDDIHNMNAHSVNMTKSNQDFIGPIEKLEPLEPKIIARSFSPFWLLPASYFMLILGTYCVFLFS